MLIITKLLPILMCGSLILLILFVKYILRCSVANSLFFFFAIQHFFGYNSFGSKPACVNKFCFSTSVCPVFRLSGCSSVG
jgi:hypothetical protein